MKWRGRRTSSRIEDRRHQSGGVRRGGARIGGLGAILVLLAGLFFGFDVSGLMGGGGVGFSVPQGASVTPNRVDDETEEFIGVVLADTEEVWTDLFQQMGRTYHPPTLVLFAGQTSSSCGAATAASGPFYCPADDRAYLDTDFFQVMEKRLGAKGDFAAAYVIAHEVAHHVQNELGILPQVNAQRQRVSETESNRLSVLLELQADCLSGVWARQAQARFGILEPGDIEEALNAASQIGDDTLQRRAGKAVVPDSFQHGTSEQRVRWFGIGLQTGDPAKCDTFSAQRL